MINASELPRTRIRLVNEAPVNGAGSFVLYWMTANRRVEWNFALQHAVNWTQELRRPLLILEALRVDYRWAADRFHRFILDGMAENHRRLDASGIGYYPYVEPEAGAGKGLLQSLAANASIVVTDDSPLFFYPAMISAAGRRLDVSLEAVDACGLLPLRSTDQDFKTAYSFRRFLQRNLPDHLECFPQENPIASVDVPAIATDLTGLAPGFLPASLEALEDPAALARLPIDHAVAPVGVGGSSAARTRLRRFVDELLEGYDEQRNHPDEEHTSRLSAYLHFGHISPHEIFATIAAEGAWTPANLAATSTGARQGWWGMSASAEAFLDQVVTWRELGLNTCHHRPDYDKYESLPDWALATLDAHRDDERPFTYTPDELESAATRDEIWNAAQTQLVVEGRIHNYLRMLWGKKIVEWSASPEQALHTMIELNNKYALDGRDPNSYSGIFWVLGRYDRAWGPERPVFGKIRYMTSANTARKLRLRQYLDRHAPAAKRQAKATTC